MHPRDVGHKINNAMKYNLIEDSTSYKNKRDYHQQTESDIKGAFVQREDFARCGFPFPRKKGILHFYPSHRKSKSSPSRKSVIFPPFTQGKCIAPMTWLTIFHSTADSYHHTNAPKR